MTSIVLEGPIADIREREVKLLFDIAEQVGNLEEEGAADKERLLQNAADLRDMFFLVVIVGEFNAGKSTFVNALLGDELLPTGITPTTDMIELIRHGQEKKQQPAEKHADVVREWTHPNTGSPGVVIVDTPGTGSVFLKHERIAKQFLSRSDLVLFLLSAKKAFAQTERLYLELARDYGKKIILVLNQVDLLDRQERKEVEAFVKQQVSELVNLDPPIFGVSAKKALQGKRASGLFSRVGTDEGGGMDAVRQHLRETFERVPPAKQKLESQLDFAESMINKYQKVLAQRLDLAGADRAYAEQLRSELEAQSTTLADRLSMTMRELDRVFDEILERGRKFINQNLTLAKGLRPPDRDAIREKFEKEVVANSLSQIGDISEDYVSAVVDSSRRYWRNIIERLNRLEALMEKEIGTPDASGYAEQRTALQEAIAIADAELKTYRENNLAESLRDTFATNMSRFTASITGVVSGIIAIVIGVAAPGAITATTVGVLGTLVVGPVLAVGGTAGVLIYGRKLRRDAARELEGRLQALRASYHQALKDMTERERTRLLQYGQEILAPVFSRLEVLTKRFQEQRETLDKLAEQSQQLSKELARIEVRVEA
ncbi:MAG: GTP-binding protein [Chloroflexi bacterium]|nr:GTP-binding protein [Chloroflexota bacterium]